MSKKNAAEKQRHAQWARKAYGDVLRQSAATDARVEVLDGFIAAATAGVENGQFCERAFVKVVPAIGRWEAERAGLHKTQALAAELRSL